MSQFQTLSLLSDMLKHRFKTIPGQLHAHTIKHPLFQIEHLKALLNCQNVSVK